MPSAAFTCCAARLGETPSWIRSATIVVSGYPPYLSDLDVLTNITHTFAADMDITLTSPAGTVVTLTTDNGAGNDNTFNGTLWDDQADPDGQVPYTTNAGMAMRNNAIGNQGVSATRAM